MLDVAQVNEIGAQVARQYLPPGSVLDVESREGEGPYGEDIFKVLVVLSADVANRVTGDHVLAMVYQLQRHLEEQGEGRFAVVQWATDAELAEELAGHDGDS
jgi:hypothetical protein